MNTLLTRENGHEIDEERLAALSHIIEQGNAHEGDENYNSKIDVLSVEKEGPRAEIYQAYTMKKFIENDTAYGALERFGLAGDAPEKGNWTQLLEHIAGVTAIADHLATTLEKYGAAPINHEAIETAALFDNLEKPDAVFAGRVMLETAALVHDIEKPAELKAAQEMAAENGEAGGLENNTDNPVLRAGKLWKYLQDQGISDDVLIASQNTGRSDRFFSDFEDYDESGRRKAEHDRDTLAELLGVNREIIDSMAPEERRRASIEAKGPVAAIVGISDALAAQFRFQGMREGKIDAMSAHYLTYKKDPESVAFFGQDWPAYYKQVRQYLIDQAPEANRTALTAEFDALTHEHIFDETVLPEVIGGVDSLLYDELKYDESSI